MKRYSNQKRTRRGYTLVELLVAVGVSSTLAVGLPASIYVVSQSMNADNKTINRSSTAEVHAQLINDLKHATTFSELTNLAVTMKVPDRDNDSQPETIRYSWSGTAGDSLMYEYNGSTAIALATNVHNFDLSYLTRLIEAPVIPDPIYIPENGDDVYTFGNETEHDKTKDGFEDSVIATRVTLDETAFLQSITAYIGNENSSNSYYFAIFSDLNDSPFELLAYTEAGNATGTGWKNLSVPETELQAGTYWLAVAFTDDSQELYYDDKKEKKQTQFTNMQFSVLTVGGFWTGSVDDEKWEVSIYGTYTTESLTEPAADSDEAALNSGSSSSSKWNFGKLFGK